uniref:Aquaporin 7 n=1 Tax=Cyprinus carpio TaxID=7962 RepID=A0A8C1PUZ2_CYPCA
MFLKEEIKLDFSIMEDGSIQGHMASTVVSKMKIKNECIRVGLAETLCTFIMMVFGLGSVVQVVTGNYAFLYHTGAHMNAAVSFTMSVFGHLHWKMLPLYVFAQFLGSFFAAGAIYAIHHYCWGNLTVSGPKATAGIFATLLSQLFYRAGSVTGALIYKAFVELHHPDLKSTKTQSTEDPEYVPLEKYMYQHNCDNHNKFQHITIISEGSQKILLLKIGC